KAQLNSILASAETAVGKGDHTRARGIALAVNDLMLAADPASEWKADPEDRRRYMNALISTLRTDAREVHVRDGQGGAEKVYGAYSADSQIFAWATPSRVQFNDTKTGAVIKGYPLGAKSIRSFSLSPDGQLIALVADRQIELVDIDAGRRTAAVGT